MKWKHDEIHQNWVNGTRKFALTLTLTKLFLGSLRASRAINDLFHCLLKTKWLMKRSWFKPSNLNHSKIRRFHYGCLRFPKSTLSIGMWILINVSKTHCCMKHDDLRWKNNIVFLLVFSSRPAATPCWLEIYTGLK